MDACLPTGTESVALASAIGRVLAEPVLADRPLPPFARAMMDGVAFRSSSIPDFSRLEIAGLHAAGDPPPRPLAAGEAWEIMTGAAVPDDCDTVVPYEELAAPFVLTKPAQSGANIHPRGHDAGEGDLLVAAGSRIGAAEIAIAASVGKAALKVFRRPRVALITTGGEAVPVECTPEPWQIRRSNGPMLEAALLSLGCAPVTQGHVSDDPSEVHAAICGALAESDVLILCGGISKGKRDCVRQMMEELAGPPTFHGVRLRPGKPLAYWSGPPQVFALPGNPVSVLATFTRLVLPALLRLQGLSPSVPLHVPVDGITPLPGLTHLLPVAPDARGRLVARPPRNSGDFVSMTGSVGVIEIPPGPEFTPGQSFSFHPFP